MGSMQASSLHKPPGSPSTPRSPTSRVVADHLHRRTGPLTSTGAPVLTCEAEKWGQGGKVHSMTASDSSGMENGPVHPFSPCPWRGLATCAFAAPPGSTVAPPCPPLLMFGLSWNSETAEQDSAPRGQPSYNKPLLEALGINLRERGVGVR